MNRIIAFCLIVGGLTPAGLVAQDKAGDVTADSFDEVYGSWTRLDGELDEVIKSYGAATPDEKLALKKEYEALTVRAQEMMPRLRKSAILRFQARPNQDEDVTKVLTGFVANDLRKDQYESVLELAEMLLKQDEENATVSGFAGVAAYSMDDFATAKTYLEEASAAGELTGPGQACLQDLATATDAWAKEVQIREAEAAANDLPRVKLTTTKGEMVIELYENEAPQAVGNFVSLVESGFYDGLTFHRVLGNFMAQGGCPEGTGTGGPGYKILCECGREDYRRHFRGSLSMAHAGPNTGGSQFFLTFKRTSHLDGKHTVFGRVIEGLDLLASLQRRNPQYGGNLPEPDKIVKAEVLRKRDHEYVPTKAGE